MSTCGLWSAVITRSVSCASRLAARDVERRDHDVEPREQLVGIVQRAVGADLELAAVEQPEAVGVRLGRGRPVGLLVREPLVEGRDDRALLLDPSSRDPAAIARLIEWSVRTSYS